MTDSKEVKLTVTSLKMEALESFVKELEFRAKRNGIIVDRKQMIGRKRDFISTAKKWNFILKDLGESSFEEYMRKIGCKFPVKGALKNDHVIIMLFSDNNDINFSV